MVRFSFNQFSFQFQNVKFCFILKVFQIETFQFELEKGKNPRRTFEARTSEGNKFRPRWFTESSSDALSENSSYSMFQKFNLPSRFNQTTI